VKRNFWNDERWLSDYLVHEIKVTDDLTVVINTILSAEGWWIEISVRRKNFPIGTLRTFLRKCRVRFVPKEANGRLSHPTHAAYTDEVDSIKTALQDTIDKIAGSSRLRGKAAKAAKSSS
jgi:hypothetical protein